MPDENHVVKMFELLSGNKWKKLGVVLIAILILFLLYFYRKPHITLRPSEQDIIRSPAFGHIMDVTYQDDNTIFIAIFLSPTDIHYQLNPCNAVIEDVQYDPTGQFNLAFDLNKSRENEKAIISYRIPQGILKVYQIAGFLVRRIKTYVKPGDAVVSGDFSGMIQFGSRVDMIIPNADQFELLVEKGQYMTGSDTVIGLYR